MVYDNRGEDTKKAHKHFNFLEVKICFIKKLALHDTESGVTQQSARYSASGQIALQLSCPHTRPSLHSLSLSQSPSLNEQGRCLEQWPQSELVPFPKSAKIH